MADRIIVVGGGGFGRELMCWLEDCAAAGTLPRMAGFIDDNPAELRGYGPRLGSIQDFTPGPRDLFALGVASPSVKRRLAGLLHDRGGKFPVVIHPTAIVVRTAQVAEGVVMCPRSTLTADTRIERFVTMLNTSGVGHDSVVGEFSTISSVCDVMGNAVIGSDVFLGSSVRILPKVKIGSGAIVGAGVTVIRSVRPGDTVYNPPPKILRAKTAGRLVQSKEVNPALPHET